MTNTKKNVEYPSFSVAMCVYEKDNSEWFDMAISSIINQTVKPSEIVLVVDGAIPDSLQQVLDKYETVCKSERILLRIKKLPENKGLGIALNIAIKECNHELIARMDSDDIAIENRFSLQLTQFLKDEDLSICGGQIEEFIDMPSNTAGFRLVPVEDTEIKEYLKIRCPFNHMTVMFKKNDVIKAGNYRDFFYNEDYFLWIRMALKKQRFHNVPEVLVRVRVGNDMYSRRGGMKYFKSEIGIQNYMYRHRMISLFTYISNCVKRFVIQMLLPDCVRGMVFRNFARRKKNIMGDI